MSITMNEAVKNIENLTENVCIKWEGGGDSGWAYFEVDGEQTENEYTEALVGYMYDELDYGSWAGEFSASGKATYNPKTKSFEGIDFYSEDESESIDAHIKIAIPKDYWFDQFHLEIECYNDETPNVLTSFNVKNGFLVNKHTDFCHNLQEVLRDDLEAIFQNYESKNGSEFRSCSQNFILERSEAKELDDMLIFNIEHIDIQVSDTNDRDIVLELTDEMIEDIDESLNANYAD